MVKLPPPSPPRRKSAASIDPDFDSRATVQALRSVRPTSVTVPPAAPGPGGRVVAALAVMTTLLVAGATTAWWVFDERDDEAAASDEAEAEAKGPSKSRVEDLIEDLQEDVLGADSAPDPDTYLADEDREQLTRLVDELRALSVGEPALVGLWAAGLAVEGKLDTACKRTTDHLPALWHAGGDVAASCDTLDARIARALLASTLRGGDEIEVVSVEDARGTDAFVAKVEAEEAPFEVWLSQDSGKLRIKLFDDDGKLYAEPSGDLDRVVGRWSVSHPRKPSPRLENVDQTTTEEIIVTRDGERWTLRHRVLSTYYGKPGARFRCNEEQNVEVGWSRELHGGAVNGGVLAKAAVGDKGESKAKRIGRDAEECKWSFNAITAAFVRSDAGKLTVWTTDGDAELEQVSFARSK